tara:strand:+ start:644 stop:1762 length:1119 start_codon:yes stop_codon:yes gene_type:complete
LGARPRELHLIPLEFRGSFEYFSFHSQKLFLFSFSTTTLLIYSIIIFYRKKLVLKKNKLFTIFFFVGLFSLISGLISDKILVQFIISDLKWLIAFFIGLNITFSKKEIIFMKNHLTILMYSTIIITFFCLLSDFLLDEFKFKYSINFIYIVPVVGFLLLIKGKRSSLFLFNIPVTTTDIFFYIGLIFKRAKLKILLLISSFAIILVIFSNVSIDKVENDSFAGFLLRESKIITDIEVDKSLLVRYYEINSFFKGSALNILLGRGFGSYFELNDFPLDLDLSDFSEFELINKKFNQPHSFIVYLLMKFGIIGFLLISYFSFKYTYGSLFFRFIFTLSILTSFYWVPLIAFMWGSYNSIINQYVKSPNSIRTIY